MPNEAPAAETADADYAALLHAEQEGLQAQLTELGFADRRAGSTTTRTSPTPARSRPSGARPSAWPPSCGRPSTRWRPPSTRLDAGHLRPLRGVWQADRRRPARSDAGGPPLHRRRRQALGAPAGSPLAGRRPMDQRTKRTLWVVAGVLVVIALVAHHNITSKRSSSSAWSCRRSSSTRCPTAGWPTRSATTPPSGRSPDPQPARARRSRRDPHRAGAAVAGRLRRLRLGQAGPGQHQLVCAARATRASWWRWPGRPSTWSWPPFGASSSSSDPPGPTRASGLPDRRADRLLLRPGQRRLCRLQPDPDPAAGRLGRLRAAAARPYWPTYLRYPAVHHADPLRPGPAEPLSAPARAHHLALRPPLQLVGQRAGLQLRVRSVLGLV